MKDYKTRYCQKADENPFLPAHEVVKMCIRDSLKAQPALLHHGVKSLKAFIPLAGHLHGHHLGAGGVHLHAVACQKGGEVLRAGYLLGKAGRRVCRRALCPVPRNARGRRPYNGCTAQAHRSQTAQAAFSECEYEHGMISPFPCCALARRSVPGIFVNTYEWAGRFIHALMEKCTRRAARTCNGPAQLL